MITPAALDQLRKYPEATRTSILHLARRLVSAAGRDKPDAADIEAAHEEYQTIDNGSGI